MKYTATNDIGEEARKFRKRVVEDEYSSDGRHILLSASDARAFQRSFGGVSFTKFFFGLPMDKAIAHGYRISRKGFFETTHYPVMQATAQKIRSLLGDTGITGELEVVDLFTGTGQSAWAYAREGFVVTAVESDTFTANYARQNMKIGGVADTVTILNTDALAVIATAKKTGGKYAAISLDPPWVGNYDYDLTKAFRLEHTEPQLDDLIREVAPLAQVIVMRTPQTIDLEQVYTLGNDIGRRVLVEFQDMEGYSPTEQTASIYFITGGTGNTTERILIPHADERNPQC